jgi:hypothetical protein
METYFLASFSRLTSTHPLRSWTMRVGAARPCPRNPLHALPDNGARVVADFQHCINVVGVGWDRDEYSTRKGACGAPIRPFTPTKDVELYIGLAFVIDQAEGSFSSDSAWTSLIESISEPATGGSRRPVRGSETTP